MENELFLKIKASLKNESFIRSAIASFISYLNPSINEIQEIKTAVSEAITNCIVHGYEKEDGYIDIFVNVFNRTVNISIKDYGKGIENIEEAIMPSFTTRNDSERSGMGFTLMNTFMDEVKVNSIVNSYTEVFMKKYLLEENLC